MTPVARQTVVLLTAMALAPAALASPRVRVESIALRGGAVEIATSAPVEPATGRLASPPRVFVDLHDATLAPGVARSVAGVGAVKQVRAGQFDAGTVRVVVELEGTIAIDVQHAGTTVRLVPGSGGKAAPARTPATPSRTPAPVASSAPIATASRGSDAGAATAQPSAAATSVDVPRVTVVRLDAPPAHPTAVARVGALPVALADRIARRAAADDAAGVVALDAADARTIRRDADDATRVAVVDALREMGLAYSARKLLGPPTPNEAPALRVARAELALARGATDDAARLVAGLDEAAVDPVLVPKLQRVRVRLALAHDDFDGAASGIGTRVLPELRAELAARAIVAGRRATQAHACRRAVDAFRRALDADGGRTARAAAGAGLVRAALACRDGEAAMSGLGVLAESPHPLLRRAAAVIATTQTEETRTATAIGRRGG